MPVRAVLADWGHTLFDTAGSVDFVVGWARSNGFGDAERAEVFDVWESARMRSRSAEELAKGRDKDASIHRACWTQLWSELDRRWPGVAAALYEHETSASGWSPYVDTPGFLREVAARGVPLVIVSDVPFDLRPILAAYGLQDLVHSYVLSGEHGTVKSEHELFRIALRGVGVEPSEALMIGDNQANDGAAIDVGIRTLLLPPVPSGSERGLHAALRLLD